MKSVLGPRIQDRKVALLGPDNRLFQASFGRTDHNGYPNQSHCTRQMLLDQTILGFLNNGCNCSHATQLARPPCTTAMLALSCNGAGTPQKQGIVSGGLLQEKMPTFRVGGIAGGPFQAERSWLAVDSVGLRRDDDFRSWGVGP